MNDAIRCVGIALFITSCSVSLEVPDGAVIRCKGAADCPKGLVCHDVRHECVPSGDLDLDPPAVLGNAAVTPDIGKVGTVFNVMFSVDDTLATMPEVSFNTANGPRLLDPPTTAPIGSDFVYTYTAIGDELEGANPLRVVLEDTGRNVTAAALGVALVFDFTAPDVVGPATVRLLPDPIDNPLRQVDTATFGTLIEISFAVDEPVPDAYEIVVTADSPGPLSFDVVSRSATGFTCQLLLDSATPPTNGEYGELDVILSDRAGNERTRTLSLLPPFEIDTQPPPLPAVDSPDAIVYVRSPWGSEASLASPLFILQGGAASVEAGSAEQASWVLVFGDEDGGAEIGRARAAADGSFGPVVLNQADRPMVWMSVVDPAGNRTAPTLVKDVQWLATLNGKVNGSTFENPHEFYQRHAAAEPLTDAGQTGHGLVERLARLDGVAASSQVPGDWQRVGLDVTPTLPQFQAPALAFDRARQRTVLFGGSLYTGSGFCPDLGDNDVCASTWEWDGRRWHVVSVDDPEGDGNPVEQHFAPLAYDSLRRHVVLLNGRFNGTPASTWEWDGRSWERRCDGEPAVDVCEAPLFRFRASLAYDARRRRVVLFGGQGTADFCSDANFCDDTLEWDGKRWHEIDPDDPEGDGNPGARSGYALAYDPAREVTVLVGGYNPPATIADTWEWDGQSWSRRCDGAPASDTCTSHPPASNTGHLVYSEASEAMTYVVDGSATLETWHWTGSDWLPVAAADPEGDSDPITRVYFGAGPGPDGSILVVSGRLDVVGGTVYDDTWAWTGSSWRLEAPHDLDPSGDGEPPKVKAAAAAFDESRGRVVLFGGYVFSSPRSSQTWEWDGLRWERPAIVDNAGDGEPGPRQGHKLVYDSDRGVVVLFGGQDSPWPADTWEWDGSEWLLRCDLALGAGTCANSPGFRAEFGMAYDRERQVTVLFGGQLSFWDETWLWDGTDWTLANPTDPEGDGNPAGRAFAAMTYDIERRVVVLFGGEDVDHTYLGDTWEWDGLSWNLIVPSDPEGDGNPSPRRYASMVYDAARKKALLFGGRNVGAVSQVLGDVWEWNGESWYERAVVDLYGDGRPRAALAAMAWGGVNERALIYGGSVTQETTSAASWLWDGGASWSPSHLATTRWAAARGPHPETCLPLGAVCPIQSIDVRWHASGIGGDAGGARLYVWQEEGWQPVDAHAEPQGAFGMLQTRVTDPARIGRMLTGPEPALHAMVTPVTVAGGAWPSGTVSSDYVEVVVSYRLGVSCGDGVVNGAEACDDGDLDNGDGCDENCTVSACGNAIIAPDEACDDGNTTDDDGCDSNCQYTGCGNGIQTPGEGCDDGNVTDGDGCSKDCLPEGGACGDGTLNAGEECDDNNTIDGDGCDSNCRPTGCGNGVQTSGEECDDGNLVNNDGCDENCTPTGCGNGIRTGAEQCDDGGTVDGDNCSATCRWEGSCSDSYDITANIDGASITGNMIGRPTLDDLNIWPDTGACGIVQGPAAVYSIRGVTGDFAVTPVAAGTDITPFLFARVACSSGGSLDCDIDNAIGFTASNPSSRYYIIIVDIGGGGGAGNYEFTITSI